MPASTQNVLQERSFRFLAGYSIVLASAQVGCIALSLAKIVISQAVAILVVAASVAAGCAYAVRVRSGNAAPADQGALPWRKLLGLPLVVLSVAGSVYILTWIAAWTKPDLSWDGNSYHIPMIHMWALRGYIHWIKFDYDPGVGWTFFLQWLCNGYPKGAETIAFLLVRAVGASNPVNTSNLVFLPMGVAGVVVTSRAVGASRAAAYTAGFAFGLVPVLVSQGNTAYVDAALANTIAGLVGCLSVVLAEIRRDRPPTLLLLPMGSAIGLAAASKSSGLAPAMLAGAAIAATIGWHARRRPAAERGILVRAPGSSRRSRASRSASPGTGTSGATSTRGIRSRP
jgi:hypothetical protein